MTPFTRASIEPESRAITVAALKVKPLEFWKIAFEGRVPTQVEVDAAIEALIVEREDEDIFVNDTYQVNVRKAEAGEGWPSMIHLSIKRLDREPVHDWRDLQAIKNMLVGKDHEAVELYPADERLVDSANQYHLWVFADSTVRLPFGFTQRFVDDCPFGSAKQRPLHEKSSDE